MRILFLTESLSISMGGLATGTINLAIGLSNHFNHDQHQIITFDSNDKISFEEEYKLPNNLSIVKLSKFGPDNYPISLEMRRRIKDFNPDVLYLKGLWRQTSIESYYWKKRNPQKILVVSPAGMLQPVPFQNKKILKLISIFFIEKKLFKVCDLLQAVSVLEKNHILNSSNKFRKIVYIPEGLPKINYSFSKNKVFSKELISISRIAPIKGLEILIDACKDISFNGWKVLIYGNGSKEYVQKLESIIIKNKLSEKVIIKNGVFGDNKYKVLNKASAFILPSYSESFGIGIAEAMFFSLPVIATTKTPWEVIKTKKLGWFINPEVHELKISLATLFSSSEENLREIGARAKLNISNTYDLVETSRQMKDEILSLTKNN